MLIANLPPSMPTVLLSRFPLTVTITEQMLILHFSGGEEVLLDVAGQDGSEAFEDVGHSDEAREILDGLLVGNVKRMVCPVLNLHHHSLGYNYMSLDRMLTSAARRPPAQGPGRRLLLLRLRFFLLRRHGCRPVRCHPDRWCHRLRRLQLPPGPAAAVDSPGE